MKTYFHFNKTLISNYSGNNIRIGWHLQQLIKFYSGFVIKDVLNDCLVIDSDTCFYKHTAFFENGLPLYNFGTENHLPHFEHMNHCDVSQTFFELENKNVD